MEFPIITDQVKQAMEVLKQNGFYVENLWHINDVKNNFPNISDEVAYSILDEALTQDEYFERGNDSIVHVGKSKLTSN